MTLDIFGNAMKFLNIMAIILNFIPVLAKRVLILLLCASTQALAGGVDSAPVGEVSLVLGKAWLESAERGRRPAEIAAKVYVNDRIITGANGHVHLHFIDQALVSVRPESLLEIQRYDYDELAPEQSSVKFRLDEGVTRSISGDAARSARERFRLNTPIAAIGVRGTDFVVSASDSTTEAKVYEGIIVLAPYSPECSIDSFGPCVANAVELSGNSLQTLAINSSETLPRILPAVTSRNPERMREDVAGAVAANTAEPVGMEQEEDSQLIAAVDTTPADNGESRTSSLEVVQEAVTTPQVTSDADAIAGSQVTPEPEVPGTVDPEIPDFTPATALSYASLNESSLVWGRFSVFTNSIAAQSDERITASFAEARAERETTIGGGGYTLFRSNPDIENPQIDQPQLSFALNSAQAFYSSEAGVAAMQVNGGSLDIDFTTNLFATELNLNHTATGAVDFQANGEIFTGGFFRSSTDNQSLSGAISIDGSEAGYFFEQQLEAGNIQGLTLWDSQ